jgi:L-asparagine transporter-like permease
LWSGNVGADGIRIYSFVSYRLGFLLMLAWLVIAIVSIALTRETHARQHSDQK